MKEPVNWGALRSFSSESVHLVHLNSVKMQIPGAHCRSTGIELLELSLRIFPLKEFPR